MHFNGFWGGVRIDLWVIASRPCYHCTNRCKTVERTENLLVCTYTWQRLIISGFQYKFLNQFFLNWICSIAMPILQLQNKVIFKLFEHGKKIWTISESTKQVFSSNSSNWNNWRDLVQIANKFAFGLRPGKRNIRLEGQKEHFGESYKQKIGI